jgi:hypothetical protein
MYTETEKWPIPVKHKEEFDFMACPLGVYRDTAFVEPSEVNETLEGAFVEAVFVIRYYYLRGKKFDTFQADIQQIKIIEPGTSIAASGFKRRNAREGPSGVMIGASTVGKDKEGGRAVKKSKIWRREMIRNGKYERFLADVWIGGCIGDTRIRRLIHEYITKL